MSAEQKSGYTLTPTPENPNHTLVGATPLPDHVLRPSKDVKHKLIKESHPVKGIHTPDFALVPPADPVEAQDFKVVKSKVQEKAEDFKLERTKEQEESGDFDLKDERQLVEGIHYPDFDLQRKKAEKVRKGAPQIQAEDYDLAIDRAEENDDFDLVLTPKDHAAEVVRMRQILAEAKLARTQKLDHAIRAQKAQEKKQKLGPKPETGHRGMRIPADAQEIAARKGARVTSSDEAYRRQFQRRVNAARTQETLQADVTNAAINGVVATTEAVKSAVDRFRRRRTAPPPPTPPVASPSPSAPTAPVIPPAPVRPAAAPITPPDPNAIPTPPPEKKGLRDKVNELLHPPEKLITEPVRIDINLAQAGENKTLEELLKEAGTPPDATESWIRDEIYNTSPQTMIDSLGLKDMLKIDDISKLPVTTPPEVDPAKIDFILDAYHLKKVLDSKLLVKGETSVKELLEKKYKKSFDAYQKLGAILQKDNLIDVFTQRVAQLRDGARPAVTIDTITMLPSSFMEGRYRLIILNDIFDQLEVKNPPVLPPGTSREEVLAALSVGETYKRVADQLYAEAKVEFELIEQDKEDRKVMPTLYGENINRADQELLKQEYGRLIQIRKQYYDSVNATAVDYKLKESLENKYREQQGKIIHLWLEKGSSNIQSSLNKIAGALYPTADGSIRWRSWNRKNTHATPHWELVTILDDIDNDRGAIDATRNRSEYEEALRLYQEAKKFTEYISDGMVLDPTVDISDKTIAQLKRNYGEIFFFHNVSTPIVDTEIDKYKPIHVDRVGIYPKANTSRNIKYFFNSQAAQIYCESLPQPAPKVEPPPETPAPPGPPIYGENVEAGLQAEFNKEFAVLLARREAFYNAVRVNEEATALDSLQQEYQAQQSKVLNMWFEKGKSEIAATLGEFEAALPLDSKIKKNIAGRIEKSKDKPLYICMSSILTELQKYDTATDSTVIAQMRKLYENARELSLQVSDGVILDREVDIKGKNKTDIESQFGIIRPVDEEGKKIPAGGEDQYTEASSIYRVGIYSKKSLEDAIRKRLPTYEATVSFLKAAESTEEDAEKILKEILQTVTRRDIMAKLPVGAHIENEKKGTRPGQFEYHGPDTIDETEFSNTFREMYNVIYADIAKDGSPLADLLQEQILTDEPSNNHDARIIRLHFFTDHSNSDTERAAANDRFSEACISFELPDAEAAKIIELIGNNPDIVESMYQSLYPDLDSSGSNPGMQRVQTKGIYRVHSELQRGIEDILRSGNKEANIKVLFDTLKKPEKDAYREFRNGPYGQVDPSAPRVEAPRTETKIPLNEIYAQLGGTDNQKVAALEQLVVNGEVTEADVRLVHEYEAVVENATALGVAAKRSNSTEGKKRYLNYKNILEIITLEANDITSDEQELLAGQISAILKERGDTVDTGNTTQVEEIKRILRLLKTAKL